MKKARALVLLSGGLDSILTAELLRRQGVDVQTLSFKSYFFNEEAAKKAAENLNISLRVVDFSKEHLRLVKNRLVATGNQ
jgi:tRNA-uridine 2-sulfurtransferase